MAADLREWLAEQGYEFTPDEAAVSSAEADARIGDHCKVCGSIEDTRHGVCFDCCFVEQAERRK